MKLDVDRLELQHSDLFDRSPSQIKHPLQAASRDLVTDRIEIFFEEGDLSPSLFLPDKFQRGETLRLDPFMRRHKLHGISRISVAPNGDRIALVARKITDESPVALIITRPEHSARILEIRAYDAAWANNDTVYFSTLVNHRPQQLYAVQGKLDPRLVLTTKGTPQEILISGDSRNQILFAQTVSPSHSSIVTFDAQRAPFAQHTILKKDLPGARCIIWKKQPACLSFVHNTYGQITSSIHGIQTPLLSGSPSEPIVDLDLQGDRLLAFSSTGTSTILRVLDSRQGNTTVVKTQSPVTTLVPALRNGDGVTPSIQERSFNTPTALVSIGDLLKDSRPGMPSTASTAKYQEESLVSTSEDGVRIPISLVRPKATRALIINAYGAYGSSMHAEYSELQQALLSDGVAIANVHVRGGGEFGPGWHAQARRETKGRSVTDLITATIFLQRHLKVAPQACAAYGRSAGGWLIAKAAITSPDLFGAIVLDAPLLNVAHAVSDPTVALFDRDSAEWGTLHASMLSAWPLPTHLALPVHILVTIPMRDELIDPRETLVWTLRARCQQSPGYITLVNTLANALHSGGLNRSQEEVNNALTHAFIQEALLNSAQPK
jgi:protease II